MKISGLRMTISCVAPKRSEAAASLCEVGIFFCETEAEDVLAVAWAEEGCAGDGGYSSASEECACLFGGGCAG